MANLNRVTLIGRLLGDPDVSVGPDQRTVASIVVRIDEFGGNGQSREVVTTEHFHVHLRGAPASYAAAYLFRGTLVLASGRLGVLRTEGHSDGAHREQVVIVVERADGLQALAQPGHQCDDTAALDVDDETGSGRCETMSATDSAESSPVHPTRSTPELMDPSSRAFEEHYGLQRIPF